MQRLATLWKASTGGKIIIIAGSLLTLCLSCVGLSLALPTPEAEPVSDVGTIQTSAFETVLASVPNSPTSPASPAPQATSTITLTSAPIFTDIPLEEYPLVASSRFQTFREALMEFTQIHTEFTADITLSQSDDWYFHASATLFRVTAGADELAGMNNYPPEYQAFHDEMIAMSEQGKSLSDNYTLALDNQDMTALNNATANLSTMITYTNQAGAQINSLAPTPTLQPTALPTATLIVVVPTSQPAVGVCSCSGDQYNCSKKDFSSRSDAQACYNYCISVGAGDIHNLDGDGDGTACQSGLN